MDSFVYSSYRGYPPITVLLVCLLPGCGVDRPSTVAVCGRLSLNGGKMPAAGEIYFTTLEAADGFPARPGLARFDIDGRFAAQTFVPGDGLLPGRYLAKVYCWEEAPQMEQPKGKSYIPPQYGDAEGGGWVIEVQPGERGIVLVWNITSES